MGTRLRGRSCPPTAHGCQMFLRLALKLCIALFIVPTLVSVAHSADELAVADGLTVTLEYTLSLPDHSVVDSNVGQAPFTFTQGAHEIVPGLENALVGMKPGETKRIEVSAVEGYGPYDKKARTTVELSRLPQNLRVGDLLQASDGRLVKVLELKEDSAVLDLNHPLAGKNLTFDVTVINVEKSAPDAPPKSDQP